MSGFWSKGNSRYTVDFIRVSAVRQGRQPFSEELVETNDAMRQDRRGFLQVAGVAAATLTLGGLPSAARTASEATGKMKIENVGLMSPGDMAKQ